MSTYLAAARAFAAQVHALPADLSGPGLGDWDLRALVGHTSRSLVTVLTYLAQPADEVAVDSAAAYFALLGTSGATSGADVTARGVAAGEALGADPAAYVDDLLDRVTTRPRRDRGRPRHHHRRRRDAAQRLPADAHLRAGRARARHRGGHRRRVGSAAGRPQRRPWLLAAEVAVLTGSGTDLLRLATGRPATGISIV